MEKKKTSQGKKYEEITAYCGNDLDSILKELERYKKKGKLVSVEFNGVYLYSDDDIDSAYKKVTGKTKDEHKKEIKKIHEQYEKEEREHEEAIPRLTKEWVDEGKKILDKKYIKLWTKCVPIRLSDLYHGMELGCCLEIVKALNKGCTLAKAKKILSKQGHSGMSYGLVCAMVGSFCDRGEEFLFYLK